MYNPPDPEQIRDMALLYATGAMLPAERDEFERLLASGDTLATSEVQRNQVLVQNLVAMAGAAGPGPQVKDRLMAAIGPRKTGFDEPLPGIFVLKAEHGRWIDTGHPGCTFQLLHLEKETRVATSILRLEPGARYPAHRHTMLEQCLVLTGDVRLGDLHIFAGDYEKAMPGTHHGTITSDTGCDLLIISCLEDEFEPSLP